MKCRMLTVLLMLIIANHGECLSRQTMPDSPGDPDSTSPYSTLSVVSLVEGVGIIVDTMFVGFTPKRCIQVSSGIHIMRFIHPDNRNWFNQSVVETVQLKPGEHRECDVKFPSLIRVSTSPFNAIVSVGDSVYGRTPIMIQLPDESLSLSISKSGFDDISAVIDRDQKRFHVDLQRPVIPDMSPESFYITPVNTKKYTSVYASAGATVLAGAAAAFFKIKADNYYSDYKHSGDPIALDRVHSFDTASGVSLIVAEMSFFLFSYFLFSQ